MLALLTILLSFFKQHQPIYARLQNAHFEKKSGALFIPDQKDFEWVKSRGITTINNHLNGFTDIPQITLATGEFADD